MSEPTAAHRLVGQTISHYRLVDRLGAGGMGEVYAADDLSLGRTVALKVLPSDVVHSPERRLRFEREARAVAALDHPNILAIHDFGEHDGIPFVVMERLEGETLREHLARGPVTPSKAAAYARQIADGLAAAHEKGVIHRDLKPENLFLTRDGRVKILDFGLATINLGAPSTASLAPTAAGLTTPGVVMGTASYMAPEQVRGAHVDARADIFAFGAVLYEMITGRRAFSAGSTVETMNAVLSEDPPEISSERSNVGGLGAIARRCLEKNPDERFQSARDVAFALDAISNAAPARPAPVKASRRLILSGIAVSLVVIAAAFVIVRVSRPSATPAASQRRIVILPFQNVGPSSDEYFASGLTEELSSRLAVLKGLELISRNSADRYAKSGKTTKEIGSELGVEYIVSGSVQWARNQDGVERVRVIPQLVRVSDDTSVWSDRYDRVVAEIFAVQSEIAERVASELDLTLLAAQRQAMEARPTNNLEAYQAYLRGVDLDRGADRVSDSVTRRVAESFQRAAALDPWFALAHARLSRAYSNRYRFGFDRSDENIARARAEADRARALNPALPETHIAFGMYHYSRAEYDQALQELGRAQRDLPGDTDLPFQIAAVYRRQGRFEESLAQFKRAAALDPHSPDLPREIAGTSFSLRKFDEALTSYDRAIAAAPNQVLAYAEKARCQISATGDLAKARATLEGMPDTGDQAFVNAWLFQEVRERNFRSALARASSMRFDVLASQAGWEPRALVTAELNRFLGNIARARAEYDEARQVLEQEIAKRPTDARLHSALGLAYAGLGRKSDAIREATLGVGLFGPAKDALIGPARVFDLARVYTLVGHYDAAVEQLERLLSSYSPFTIRRFETEPYWDDLRQHPRYRALIDKWR